MADYDGVGRIYRSGSDVRQDQPKVVSRSDRDKQRKEEREAKEEPQDTVELHGEDGAPEDEAEQSPPEQDEPEEEDAFDISA